jgi:hypothetical protein
VAAGDKRGVAMKGQFQYLLLCLACLAGMAYALPKYLRGSTAAVAGIELTPSQQDFGERANSETVSGSFKVKNNFSQTIYLGEMLKACSCTNVLAEKSFLAPAEETKISYEWSLHNAKGPAEVEIFFMYHESEEKRKERSPLGMAGIKLSAKVSPEVTATPEVVTLSKLKPTQMVTFARRNGKTVYLADIAVNNPVLSAKIQPGNESLSISWDQSYGEPSKAPIFLNVFTEDKSSPPIVVPVTITVNP